MMTSPQVIQVIRSEETRGEIGKHDNPIRTVVQIHSLDGTLIAEHDPWLEMELVNIDLMSNRDETELGKRVRNALRYV